jgi:general secretion pathway protein A
VYETYWKLREKPFENDQNIEFFYQSRDHREALVRILYAVMESKGCVLLTGESGCGKSYLLHSLGHELAKKRVKVAMVKNPAQDPLDLLRQIALTFGVKNALSTKSELVVALEQYLAYYRERGVRAVLLIDDADTIENERAYEELRLLLNLEQNGKPLVTLVLAGQPRLRAALRRVPGLAQRVAVSFHLPPLSEDDAIQYVNHRMKRVDGDYHIFELRALREVFRNTRGVPRLINHICDLSLLLGAAEGRRNVDARIVAKAREELKEIQG